MATSKFARRNTMVDLDIEGNVFSVDFGRDDIPVLIGALAQRAEIQSKMPLPTGEAIKERLAGMQEESKREFEKAINGILEDETASDRIFVKDQRMSFHSDVYEYLITEYNQVMGEPYAEYSPNRAQRRIKK